MKKRYKVIINVDINDPEKPVYGSGDYSHLNRIQATVKSMITSIYWTGEATITLDKVIDKGEIE